MRDDKRVLNGNERIKVYAAARWLRVELGISDSHITKHAMQYIDGERAKMYDVANVIRAAPEIVIRHLGRMIGEQAEDADDLKSQKLREEIRALRLKNDEEEAALVRASTVQVEYSRGIKKICAVLDGIPQECKKSVPNLPPAALVAIRDCVVKIRNIAAMERLEE
jgi:phage terminase Nu1 subunit (DNA packaging protein)